MPSVVVVPNVQALAQVELIRTQLANCEVKLFTNDYTPTPSTVLGDLTEATFGGYAAEVVVALLPAYLDPVGGASAQIATVQFDGSGVAPFEDVFGFWVETMAGVLVMVGRFENPVPMGELGQSLPIDVKFNVPN